MKDNLTNQKTNQRKDLRVHRELPIMQYLFEYVFNVPFFGALYNIAIHTCTRCFIKLLFFREY